MSGPGSTAGRDPVGGGSESRPDSLTAYVIMKPADRSQRLDVAITSENIGALQPVEAEVAAATSAFAAGGFAVGPFVGISFSITGPPELYRRTFGVSDPDELDQDAGGGTWSGGLPLDRLDRSLSSVIDTVVFDEPAELFGLGPSADADATGLGFGATDVGDRGDDQDAAGDDGGT